MGNWSKRNVAWRLGNSVVSMLNFLNLIIAPWDVGERPWSQEICGEKCLEAKSHISATFRGSAKANRSIGRKEGGERERVREKKRERKGEGDIK